MGYVIKDPYQHICINATYRLLINTKPKRNSIITWNDQMFYVVKLITSVKIMMVEIISIIYRILLSDISK